MQCRLFTVTYTVQTTFTRHQHRKRALACSMLVRKMLAESPNVHGDCPGAPNLKRGSFHTLAHTHLPIGFPSNTSIRHPPAPPALDEAPTVLGFGRAPLDTTNRRQRAMDTHSKGAPAKTCRCGGCSRGCSSFPCTRWAALLLSWRLLSLVHEAKHNMSESSSVCRQPSLFGSISLLTGGSKRRRTGCEGKGACRKQP